jgi:hypothetical protein
LTTPTTRTTLTTLTYLRKRPIPHPIQLESPPTAASASLPVSSPSALSSPNAAGVYSATHETPSNSHF